MTGSFTGCKAHRWSAQNGLLQVEDEYEAALAARRAEMEAEQLRKDLEQLSILGEVSDPTTSSVPSLAAEEPLADSADPAIALQHSSISTVHVPQPASLCCQGTLHEGLYSASRQEFC